MIRIIRLTVVLVGILLCAGCVSSPFFYPSHDEHSTPKIKREEVTFRSADYTGLHGWFMPAAKGPAKATVIFFHGNALNLTFHYQIVSWLPDHGYNVFIFDYRGYGKSYAKPTTPGVIADGKAAIEYVRSRKDVDKDRLLVYGQSLGGAVAVTVVGKYQPEGIRGMLIDSAFSSYPGIAAEKLRKGGLFWPLHALVAYTLVRGTYNPIRFVDKLTPRPTLFLHGGNDRIVPKHHSERLFEAANQRKGIVIFPGARHGEACVMYEKTYRDAVLAFFGECLKSEKK